MDIKVLMDQMLQSGKDMATKGQNMAEQQLGIPKQGEQRDAMVSGIKTGAAAAGVLALLLGTGTGRRVTGTALKLGSLAAVGGLAYQMYNRWQQGQAAPGSDGVLTRLPAPEVRPPQVDERVLLRAMVAAAKADGHVDQNEMAAIRGKLDEYQLGREASALILQELTTPVSATDIAALAQGDKQAALEIYLVSSLVVDDANQAEQEYLADLQQALGLPDEVVKTA